MTASKAPSAAPSNALRVWTDSRSIYVELPGRAGPSILTYPLSDGGLSKALSLLRTQRYDFGGAVETSPKALSTSQSAQAESILRQRGIIR
jgi:hypothetical protein